jgi:ubiquinone/menaquinone biosynthesis C-methylase UbiE
MRVLECGCGMGRVVKHLGALGYPVVGMDYEPRCIERLHRQRPALQLYVGDANALPHPTASFDAALCFGTLSNLEDAAPALRELRRVLRPGGILVASATNDSLPRRLLTWAGYARGGARRFSMVAYTPSEWSRTVAGHGFEIAEITPVVTRLPLYAYLPFLRARGTGVLDWRLARDGDRGLRLNAAGEWLFRQGFRRAPFWISHGVVAVARASA